MTLRQLMGKSTPLRTVFVGIGFGGFRIFGAGDGTMLILLMLTSCISSTLMTLSIKGTPAHLLLIKLGMTLISISTRISKKESIGIGKLLPKNTCSFFTCW